MEKFKAVEKAMKTKAYSKEGLSAAAKLDPKEQAKVETCEFLGNMVDELEHQVEALEAEGESIQATMKKGKANRDKADRVAEIERVIERHKWHQGRLELVRRLLENGGLDTDQVKDIEESIRYYVSDGANEDFMEDEEMYVDLNLDHEEDVYGMTLDNDKGSTEDTRSIQDDPTPELEPKILPGKPRTAAESAIANATGRRPSAQLKSPLPTLATLHTPTPGGGASTSASLPMKPATLPTRPPGEGLKYASAAAAAAASDKNNVGIAPLPPPPNAIPINIGINPLPMAQQARSSAASSPAMTMAQPALNAAYQASEPKHSPKVAPTTTSQAAPSAEHTPASTKATPVPAASSAKESSKASRSAAKAAAAAAAAAAATAEPVKGMCIPRLPLPSFFLLSSVPDSTGSSKLTNTFSSFSQRPT